MRATDQSGRTYVRCQRCNGGKCYSTYRNESTYVLSAVWIHLIKATTMDLKLEA